ncbi:MAG: hypothetical protein IPJ65_37090 [Archangiaceae bacterium]|nr:hypothetical protein [Archangiaceae bacterium]
MLTALPLWLLLAAPQPSAPPLVPSDVPLTPEGSEAARFRRVVALPALADTSTTGARAGGAAVGTLLGGAASAGLTAATLYAVSSGRDPGTSFEAMAAGALVGSLAVTLLLPLGTYVGHQRGGGRGSYGGAVAGALLGGAVGALLSTLGALALTANSPGGAVPLLALGGLTALVGPVIGIEISHSNVFAPAGP